MTVQRMIELLKIEHECMLRGAHDDCDRDCANCELVQDDGELHEMYTSVISLLKEQEPKRGKWIDVWDREDPYTSSEGRCSVCGRISARPLGNFCRWCGAKMREDDYFV